MTPKRITELALANGFKLKEQPDGSTALNPYVFDFVAAVQAEPLDHTKVTVDRESLKQVLQALNGHGHEIRELQLTRNLPMGPANPINTLIANYNEGL